MAIGTESLASMEAEGLTVPPYAIWRLSVGQYHEMIRAGILTEDDPVELLEGWLVTKMPKKLAHRLSTQLTRQSIERLLPSGWYVDAQEPITTDDSEPEPDVTVVRGNRRDYADRHPGPRDVALLVEVADASLARDLRLKKALYARAGFPTYWVVNLLEGRLEVFTDPTGPADASDYRRWEVYGPDDAVPLLVDGREMGRIPVRELLP
ncbi:MAG: Uma2 family endonuclease [Isosphaeraceae bacterium]|nr:Uma2 family endonuclease [Isosphaeraceae bacterium]